MACLLVTLARQVCATMPSFFLLRWGSCKLFCQD
jgi:hypothetical protein